MGRKKLERDRINVGVAPNTLQTLKQIAYSFGYRRGELERMMDERGFAFKYVYPSELGLHIEHYTEAEAEAAYVDAKSKGMNVRLDGLILTWQFYNPRKSDVSVDAI